MVVLQVSVPALQLPAARARLTLTDAAGPNSRLATLREHVETCTQRVSKCQQRLATAKAVKQQVASQQAASAEAEGQCMEQLTQQSERVRIEQ